MLLAKLTQRGPMPLAGDTVVGGGWSSPGRFRPARSMLSDR